MSGPARPAILLATSNPAKAARLRRLLSGLPFEPITADRLEPARMPGVAEDCADFAANARQKAQAWSAVASGMLTLASDGGLEIPALGDSWSALRTRRNAGAGADDAARIRHLLDLMRAVRGAQRRAFWHEALALAENGMVLAEWSASGDGGLIVEGHTPGSADMGFWTESVRYYPAAGKLYRDLTEEEIEALDGVWPRLREEVRVYLERRAAL